MSFAASNPLPLVAISRERGSAIKKEQCLRLANLNKGSH
jgi:hypothetical protein